MNVWVCSFFKDLYFNSYLFINKYWVVSLIWIGWDRIIYLDLCCLEIEEFECLDEWVIFLEKVLFGYFRLRNIKLICIKIVDDVLYIDRKVYM